MRTDFGVLLFLKKILLKHFPKTIKDVFIQDQENYGFDMHIIDFNDITYPVEVKSSIHHQLKFGDHWNNYFQIPAGKGLWKTSSWEGNLNHCYCLNASSKINNKHIPHHHSCKWEKMIDTKNSMLIFISYDGMVTWTHQQLMSSFLGYTSIICNHSTFFQDSSKGEELKAIISLYNGNYYSFNSKEREEIVDIFINM